MDNNNKMIGFDQLIKDYRKAHKLTQSEFGNLINKNQVTVSNYETKVHFPKHPEELKAIAQLLNQPIAYLINSIEYARTGVIKDHEVLLIDLDKLDDGDLGKKYKFMVDNQEVTGEDLKKILELVKFEHFKRQND